MSGSKDSWEILGEPLGEGGQSKVYLVRGPKRVNERRLDVEKIHSFNPWGTSMHETRVQKTGQFADAIVDYGRQDAASELGAMKVFKVRDEGQDGERLRQEIEVLQQNRPGLPKLLDFNLQERWIVTEFFPRGTLEKNHSLYKGDVHKALKAFRSLVDTIEGLHADGIIHRDIKPANVFVHENDQLVLGDFGIVFLPDQPTRVTLTNESVGPHDYMPPWADIDGRLGEVSYNFDLYMLGKLLWCMVAGRLRLQRERFDRAENDVRVQFNTDPGMQMINDILSKCVVEEPERCESSASTLSLIVRTYIWMLDRGGQIWRNGVPKPCRICGLGFYQPDTTGRLSVWKTGGVAETTPVSVSFFACDKCGHIQLFRPR